MAGVGVQLTFLLLFLGMAIAFHRTVSRRPNIQIYPYKTLLYLIHASVLLISIRTIFRLAEFSNGENSYSVTHEWPVLVFDALPVWIVMMFWVVYHPGRVLKGEGSEFNKQWKADKKGRKAEEKMRRKMRREGAGMYNKVGDGIGNRVSGVLEQELGVVQGQERGLGHTAYAEYGQSYEMQRPLASYGA